MAKMEADLLDDFGNLVMRTVVEDSGHVVLWTHMTRKHAQANPATGMMVYGNQIGDPQSGLDRAAFVAYLERVVAGLRSIT